MCCSLFKMHPWKQIIRGETKEETAAITCFMCLQRTANSENDKFKKHMTKIHSATCSMENLTQLCKDEEERLEREGWSVDDIIMEEAERREAEKKTSGGQEVTQPELGTQDIILTCFLCQGAWTGDNKDDLQRHLEKDHKAIFKISELMELSVNKKTDEAGATGDTEATEATGSTTATGDTGATGATGEDLGTFFKIK